MTEIPINKDAQPKLLDKVFNSLKTKSEKEEFVARAIGYTSAPPSIQEVLENDYYLGHSGKAMYPIWKERLYELYPDRVTTKSTVVIPRGALGTGKSYFSMHVLAYDLIRWGWHPDPYPFLGLNKTTSPTTFRFFNLLKSKAYEVLINPFIALLEDSPYFKERRLRTGEYYPHGIKFSSAKRAGDIISEVLLGTIFSEANFFKREVADEILSTIVNRMTSRMQKARNLWTHIIIDSSDTDENSLVDTFIRNNSFSTDDVSIFTTSIWEAKKHLGAYGNTGWFYVYTGHSGRFPFIIEDPSQVESLSLDKDRILKVPNELRPNYDLNIIQALQDTAGISVNVSNRFFLDQDRLKESFSIDQELDDILIFDFYDNEEIWDRIGDTVLKLLPKERKVYGRIDLGVAHDNTGLVLGYGDRAEYVTIDGKRVFKGYYKIPIITSISRNPGQETPISKIARFFIRLSQHREIANVSTDQYQSTQTRQELIGNGIPTNLLSVDRNDDAYNISKSLIMSRQVAFANNRVMGREARELIRVGQKVDHPSTGSKDICDAAFGALYKMYNDREVAFSQVEDEKVNDYMNLMSSLASRNKKRLNNGLY